MDLFDLSAKLSLDASNFTKGVSEAESQGNSLSEKMGGMFDKIETAAKLFVSGAAVNKVVQFVKGLASDTAEAGDKIDKQSQVLGMSRKAYQEWDYVLSQNGASIDNMALALKTMDNVMGQALTGSKEAKQAFLQLGLSAEDMLGKSEEEKLDMVVKAFNKLPPGAQKSALAIKLFGKQGQQLLPLLNQSSESIDNLKTEANELGMIMSDDAIDASVAYGDSLDKMHRTFDGLKFAVGSTILPVLTNSMEKITAFAGKLKTAFDDNGLAGVWDVIKESFKNIKWPTWEEVKEKLVAAWGAVKEGAKEVLKLVFGETPDGGIDWPTPEEVWAKVEKIIGDIWNAVKEGAKSILKLVFGEDPDGGIKWPSGQDVERMYKEGLTKLWNAIKRMAKGILRLIFGDKEEDGGIEFDGAKIWEKVKAGLSKMWEYISGAAKGILKFIFGETEDGGIKFPTGSEIWEKIKEVIKKRWEVVKKCATTVLKFVFGEDEDGGIKFPTGYQIWEKIKEGLIKLWNTIKEKAASIVKLGLDTIGLPDPATVIRDIETWWNTKVAGQVNLTLGFKLLPTTNGTTSGVEGDPKSGASVLEWLGAPISTAVGQIFGHAKGAWDVPYDNYLANLHRDETVLSASQARDYKEGKSTGGIDFRQLSASIVNAVREGMQGAQFNGYLDGKLISDNVSKQLAIELAGGRFA